MKKNFVLTMMLIPLFCTSQEDKITTCKELFEKGSFTEARDCFEMFDQKHANEYSCYYLGRTEFELGEYDAAEQMLKQAIKLNPCVSDYFFWLGRIYKEKLQKSSFYEKGILSGKVLDNYIKAVKLDPANVSARIHLTNYYIHAPSIGGGSLKKAKEQAHELKKYAPEQSLKLMAQIYIQEENYDEAIAEFDAYLEKHPDDTETLYHLGMLYQGIKNFPEATACFEKAVKTDEGALASLYQVGRTAIFWGENTRRGIECLQQYVGSKPGPSLPGLDAAHWRLGMLFEISGDNDKAIQEYSAALELNPDEEKYKAALENMSKE